MKNFDQDFREWLIKQPYAELNFSFPCIRVANHYTEFNRFPDNMLFGLYVDFFDSVGINMLVAKYEHDPYPWRVQYWHDGSKWTMAGIPNQFESRNEARKAAIEKAIEIYNQ